MIVQKARGLHNPLPYIFIVFILASVSIEMWNGKRLVTVIIVTSFFVLLYCYKKFLVTLIILLFYLISIFNNLIFYSFTPNEKIVIRVNEITSFDVKADIEGRKVRLDGSLDGVYEGERIVARGKFTRNINYIKGEIGEYKVTEYVLLEDDFISKLYKRRNDIYKNIEMKLGSRKASIITSVAFGYSETLDKGDKNEMNDFGITHVVSVSGLHMALIYGILKKLLGYKLAIVTTSMYMLFTGAAPSSVRALIMIVIMSMALVFRRNYNSTASLSLAGIIILLFKPYDVYNLGFILSFLATLGIIKFNKNLNHKLYKLPSIIRSTLSISLSAQILTLPIIILYFNEFSINFIIGNLLMVPILNILVILGNLTILIYKVNVLLNYLLYLSNICISILDKLIVFAEGIKLETIYLDSNAAIFYCGLLICFYFYKKGYKFFIYYPISMLIFFIIVNYSPVPSIKYYKDGALMISFKGEKVLLQTKAKLNKEKLKRITGVSNIHSDINKLIIKDKIIITDQDKDYLMTIDNQSYLLKVNYKKNSLEYDIIDFVNGKLRVAWIVNEGMILTD